jgi:hypothetical protein
MRSHGAFLRASGLITSILVGAAGAWAQSGDPIEPTYAAVPATVDEEEGPEVAPARGAVYARLLYYEGGIFLRREDQSAERDQQLAVNSPLVPGDQIWTGEDGRAEIQLADGSVLRVDRDSRLSMLNLADREGSFDTTTLLRLLNGSLYIRTRRRDRSSSSPVECSGWTSRATASPPSRPSGASRNRSATTSR